MADDPAPPDIQQLTVQQHMFVNLLLKGKKPSKAAGQVGVTPSCAWLWMKVGHPVRDTYDRLRKQAQEQSTACLQVMSLSATRVLGAMLRSKSKKTQQWAIDRIFAFMTAGVKFENDAETLRLLEEIKRERGPSGKSDQGAQGEPSGAEEAPRPEPL